MKKLSGKRQLFVAEYLVDMDGSKAIRRAGYKVTSASSATSMAHQLMADPAIQAAIAEGMEKRVKRVHIDADWVLRSAKEVFDRCMQTTPVLDRRGEPVLVETPTGEIAPAYTFDSASACRSLELIGKHVDVQAFRDRVSHETPEDGPLARLLQQISGTSIKPKK